MKGLLAPYRGVLAAPGAVPLVCAGLVARLPTAMTALAMVLLVQATTGSYGIAGAVAAAYGLAQAITGPRLARWSDTHGQTHVLVTGGIVQWLGMLSLVGVAVFGGPTAALLGAALVCGFATVPVGSMVRARWSALLGRTPALHTAFSLESVLSDLVYVIGPVLATALAIAAAPAVACLVATTLRLAGCVALAAQRLTSPPLRPASTRPGRHPLQHAGVPSVCASLFGAGMVFGSAEVAVVAFTAERGQQAAAGAVLALWSASSMLVGLGYGARRWRTPLPARFALAAAAFGAGSLLLPAATNVALLAALMMLGGAAISPVLIGALGMLDDLVPRDRVTEGLTWGMTALNVAFALGAALTGRLVDEWGARPSFFVAAAGGMLAAVAGAATYARLHRAPTAAS